MALVCQRFRIRHKRTRPYRPQTNGKAERFIQTLLREWAYVRAYRSSSERCRSLFGPSNLSGPHTFTASGLVDQRDTAQPRNSLRTTAYSTVDARLEKVFKVGGRNALSLLIEGFNLFNRQNVKNISNVSGAEFGTPTEYFPGREIQLGARWTFGR